MLTREDALKIAKVYMILGNDGFLQYKEPKSEKWTDFVIECDNSFDDIPILIYNGFEFRDKMGILNKKDMLERIKNNKSMWIYYYGIDPVEIIRICDDCVIVHNTDIEYEDLAKHYVWVIDNTPCYNEL